MDMILLVDKLEGIFYCSSVNNRWSFYFLNGESGAFCIKFVRLVKTDEVLIG